MKPIEYAELRYLNLEKICHFQLYPKKQRIYLFTGSPIPIVAKGEYAVSICKAIGIEVPLAWGSFL
ncbi:MAG: hypothetical protein ACI8UO_004539 [Verrucomicrobiales bacterium]|jgi:hypothetical protein